MEKVNMHNEKINFKNNQIIGQNKLSNTYPRLFKHQISPELNLGIFPYYLHAILSPSWLDLLLSTCEEIEKQAIKEHRTENNWPIILGIDCKYSELRIDLINSSEVMSEIIYQMEQKSLNC